MDILVEAYHSLVVFVGNSTFKTTMPDHVTNARGYLRYIKSKRENVLKVVGQIEQLRLKRSLATNRKHVRNLKKAILSKRNLHPVVPDAAAIWQ